MTDLIYCNGHIGARWEKMCILPAGHPEMHEFREKEEAKTLRRGRPEPYPRVEERPRCDQIKREVWQIAGTRQRKTFLCILPPEHDGTHLYPVLPREG